MSSNLYEVLGLDRSASPEDVRKAYRKKALATHPDRLPPNTSETDRQRANEQFRLVNNAYEVLNDAQNRKLYDQHGVWPPPTADPTPRASSSQDSFAGFDSHPFFGPQRGFGFTDPFELFNSLFGDIHRHFDNDPFFDDFPAHRSPFESMFGGSPFGPRRDPFSSRAMLSPFGSGFPFGGTPLLDMMNGGMGDMGGGSNVRSYSSTTQSIGMNGQWVSQSKMTRTINGRTETITKMRDAQGNEHITYSSPDGERYTINGIEQPKPNDRYLPPSSSNPPPPPAVAAPPPPPAVDYGRYGRSTSAYEAAPVYSVPIASGTPQPHAVPVQKRHSTAEAYQNQYPSDGVRRSSTSSSRRHHHSDREHLDKHHRDSTSPRHSREHGRERVPDAYAYQPQYDGAGTRRDPVDLTASPPPAHQNAYVPHSRDTPSRQSRHSKHESRSGHARDEEHHGKGWTHARRWLSGLGRLFKWSHHHHHPNDEAESHESRERDTAVSQ